MLRLRSISSKLSPQGNTQNLREEENRNLATVGVAAFLVGFQIDLTQRTGGSHDVGAVLQGRVENRACQILPELREGADQHAPAAPDSIGEVDALRT